MSPSALDLFAGTKSATRFFAENGWKVDYVDILDGVDIRSFHPAGTYDFVWASPPCPEYSQGGRNKTWASKYDADRSLWIEGLRVIHEARPRYWIVENVKGAQQVWGRAVCHYGAFFLWGFFPAIRASIPWTTSLKGIRFTGADHRSAAERAVIPRGVSQGYLYGDFKRTFPATLPTRR